MAQTEKEKKNLEETAPLTTARLKFYWPDNVIDSLLPDIPGETWQKRLFLFSMANVESAGGLISRVNRNGKGDVDDTFGILQIKQIRLQDYFDHLGISPYCTASDLANPAKPDSITILLPLKILNDAARHYKLSTYEDIAFQWNLGWNWRDLKTSSTYYDKIWFSVQEIQKLQNNGYLAIYNRQPDE